MRLIWAKDREGRCIRRYQHDRFGVLEVVTLFREPGAHILHIFVADPAGGFRKLGSPPIDPAFLAKPEAAAAVKRPRRGPRPRRGAAEAAGHQAAESGKGTLTYDPTSSDVA